jgi:hypothetical protein
VRDRRAQEGDFALSGKDHVRDELAAAVQVAGVLLAQNARADALAGLTAHLPAAAGLLPTE